MKHSLTLNYLFLATALFFLASDLGPYPISFEIQLILFVVGATLIGLPHGAMDLDVAKKVGIIDSKLEFVGFIFVYIGIAALNFAAWIYFPLAGFLFFFLLSAYHFGEDWNLGSYALIRRLIFGLLFLTLPSLLHSKELIFIYSLLVPLQEAGVIVQISKYLGLTLLLPALLLSLLDLKRAANFPLILMPATFITSGIFLPPVLFLLTVFCFLHGPRHALELFYALGYKSWQEMIKSLLPIMAFTLLLLLVVIFSRDLATGLKPAVFSSLIILIACLTTPHMLLIEYFHRRQGRSD